MLDQEPNCGEKLLNDQCEKNKGCQSTDICKRHAKFCSASCNFCSIGVTPYPTSRPGISCESRSCKAGDLSGYCRPDEHPDCRSLLSTLNCVPSTGCQNSDSCKFQASHCSRSCNFCFKGSVNPHTTPSTIYTLPTTPGEITFLRSKYASFNQ